jgi:hypothetical protein
MEFKNGLMVLSMKVNGSIIKHRVKVNLFTQMRIIMKENGRMIRRMGMVFLSIKKLEPNMRVIGKMICSMDQELNFIVMGIDIKECLNKEKEMEKVPIITLLEKFIKVNGIMVK